LARSPQHRRRTPEHIAAASAGELQEDVLRPAGKARGDIDCAAAETLGIHPRGERGKIDKFAQTDHLIKSIG
jgi:hypothetical protein